MTQDAPLDQKALEAAYKVYQRIGFVPNIEHVEASIRAYLAALSRRVPASGGEADFWHNGMNQVVSNAEREGWRGTSDEDMIGRYCEPLYASPIVAAPEGWRPVPVDDDSREFANSTLPIEMIHAGMDALEKVDEDNRNYVAGETIDWDNGMVAVAVYRAMLSAAPSIPEGVAAPEGLTPEKYAEQLAVSLREKHYPEVPQFEPMTGDVMGLLSQIDNMVAGLVRATAPEGKAEGGADRRPANCRNRLHDEGKAHPKSGCAVCKTGGITGCPYERPIPEGKAEPVAYRFVPKEQTTVEDHIWRFAAMHPGDQWRVEPLFVAQVQHE